MDESEIIYRDGFLAAINKPTILHLIGQTGLDCAINLSKNSANFKEDHENR
jgi:hypothetical protein